MTTTSKQTVYNITTSITIIKQSEQVHSNYIIHQQEHSKYTQPLIRNFTTDMANARRPVQLQLRPTSLASIVPTCSPKALSPTGDSLPSQILPHLFVGNLEQTNKDTLNRLNISYILSLGLLPVISSGSPTSPTASNRPILMPTQNSSKDFKIRVRTNADTSNTHKASTPTSRTSFTNNPVIITNDRDENRAIKLVRSIHCKCINIADNSDQTLIKFFDEAYLFIDEARRKKCNILVHCLAGISRSPAIAIAYLMRYNSLRLQEAYNIVKKSRPQIDPNISFMGQLMIYDNILRGNTESNMKYGSKTKKLS